ncbi:MAG: large repetitive protein, partial [Solirubrobacteraceae bacterium]|nr:large repetitive protein [Solirubrobacteraceae bacterium]
MRRHHPNHQAGSSPAQARRRIIEDQGATSAARRARIASIGCVTLLALGLAAAPAGAATDRKVNFQSATAAVPAGYTADSGAAYSSATGQGWVREDSLGATHVPLSLTGNGRDRNIASDQRLDTFVHMQYPAAGAPAGVVTTPGAWELAVPSGAYTVTLSVGDAWTPIDSTHRIAIEGQVAIAGFKPSSTDHFMSATRTVDVTDGRLTIDARGGVNTKLDYVSVVSDTTSQRPSVTSIKPADAATDVPRDSPIAAEVHLPNVGSGVDEATLTASTVKLVRNRDGAAVAANRNTTGGGDAIILQPTAALAANTIYRIEITSGVKDISGAAFLPYTSFFTTGTGTLGGGGAINAQFQHVALPNAQGQSFTSVAIGPDNKLYAATTDGYIRRFPINADGTTGTPQVISSVRTANGGARTIIGLAFDPAATATNPILWISHNDPAFSDAADWTGKVSRLSGSSLQTVRDYVVGLPRSVRDHESNSLAFGPDGALYLTQGSDSATGAPDDQWGLRQEHILNAAVLRIDKSAITAPPVNVQSEDGGTYNPFAAGAKVSLYATGLRNAYDLVWHSNGQLYAPTNGSAAGGNTPATPSPLPASCQRRTDAATRGAYTGPSVPSLTNIPTAQDDYLNRVVKGGYYGHPNDKRCEWALNGANPTAGIDPSQVSAYPEGVQPDRNFRGAAYRFGPHYSPDGAIEYRSSAFGGALRGMLLVTRYSAGDDIIVLTPNSTNGDIDAGQTGIPGLTGFVDPLDLVEDRRNGNLYVTELGASRITLLRPVSGTAASPTMTTTPARLIFNDVQNGAASAAKSATIRNDGTAPLNVSSLSIGGADATQFSLVSPPALPATIAVGSSLDVQVVFDPSSTGPKRATLTVAGNDAAHPQRTLALRGLGTLGVGGANEPSLQWILDTYDIPINAGDPDPSTSSLPSSPLLGDEVPLQRLAKAGTGPVTVEPLAVFGPQDTASGNVTDLSWYPIATGARTKVFGVANAAYQSLDPAVSGSLSFDPGSGGFGLSTTWPFFSNRAVYSEDSRNTFDSTLAHHVRAYPLKTSDGTLVANSYVVAFEESTSGYDFQDLVFIVRNVKPAPSTSGGQVAVTNLDGAPYADRMVFNRIGSLASPPSNVVHDRATVRISNVGGGPLTINALTLSGLWSLVSPPSLPATIAAGGQLDVTLRFVAESTNAQTGTLTIGSDDATAPNTVVALAGWWQSLSENNKEPSLTTTVNTVFAYKSTLLYSGQSLNRQGRIETAGDEVLSPYWTRVDASRPVAVRQLAAFHTQGNTATIRWHARGSSSLTSIFTHAGAEGQSFLPHLNANPAFAAGSFSPAGSFGLKIDTEWSDEARNATDADVSHGCVAPCGHHMRFWPARDRAGARIADSWIVSMDYSGINYDYNDNVYLISNMKPDWTGPVLYRLDVGGSGNYTDVNGNVWKPDTGLFSPSSAPNEGATTAPLEIDRTLDDPLYRTYRGNVGSVPQDQRTLSYA